MDKEILRSGPFVSLPDDVKEVFKNILKYKVDPSGSVYNLDIEAITEELKQLQKNNVVGVFKDELDNMTGDLFIENFVLGCGGQLTTWDKTKDDMTPVVFRGITKNKYMKQCEARGRDYYYIDTGYFGNGPRKNYHRITKNAMQYMGPIIDRPTDRLGLIEWSPRKFTKGKYVLICAPSEKAMSCFGLDLTTWLNETVETIKKYTDRPIIIRDKPTRRERVTTNSLEEVLLTGNIHCLVTYNSIAATEAILLGKPAFTLGPNAAQTMCYSDLSRIESPLIPSLDNVQRFAAHLSYCQFTEFEMRDGTAWKILNETSNISFGNS